MAESTTIKSLGDIPSIGIYQGDIGQIVAPMPDEPNKYQVRFPLKNGYCYIELFEWADFVRVEGGKPRGGNIGAFAPFTFEKAANFDDNH